MRKIIERLLIFFIGVPVFFVLIFFLNEPKHLAFNIAAILFSAFGAVELSGMLEKKNVKIPKIESFILGALAPLSGVLAICFDIPLKIEEILIIGALWAVLSIVFSKKENMETAIIRFTGRIAVFIYPGFFIYWVIKMSIWESSAAVFLFMLTVFLNDSAAWLFGSLFGKNNKGFIAASPNKSIAGFIGGAAGSVLVSFLAVSFFPSMFPVREAGSPIIPLTITVIAIGLCTGIFATLGDLAESAIKRSCDFKDSGNAILGRGGVLDSIDSIALAAPVFYLLYSYFFYS